MILKQIDTRTRLTYGITLYGMRFKLQRKFWWGWKTVSSIYPCCFPIDKPEELTYEKVIEWCLWDEKTSNLKRPEFKDFKSERLINKLPDFMHTPPPPGPRYASPK